MSAPKFRHSVRGRITIALVTAAILVLPPVIAATVHLQRLRELNAILGEKLAKPSASEPSEETTALTPLPRFRKDVARITAEAERDVVSLAFLCILVLIYFIGILPTRILRPLKRLVALTKQAEGGNLSVAQAKVTPDEIGELAFRINKVLNELREFDLIKARKVRALVSQRDHLVEARDAIVALVDREARVLYLSKRFCQRFNCDRETMEHRPLAKTMGWQDSDIEAIVLGSIAAGKRHDQHSVTLSGANFGLAVEAPAVVESATAYVMLTFDEIVALEA